jgi:MFS family permease
LIRRNTLLLAVTQAVVGAGIQLLPALGAITVVQLLGNNTWAGIATALAGLARMLTAYPVGRLTDARGRKVGLYLGLLSAIGGAVLTGIAVMASSFWLFAAGILVFGAGVGATQQLRVAAADMYPPARRSEGISLVLMGSLVGAGLSPILVWLAQRLGPEVGQSPLSLAWFLVPPFILPALLLLARLRPDPKQIAQNLRSYYPSLPAASVALERSSSRPALSAATWTGIAAQGQMVMLMAMTSLALRHQGCSFELISVSVAIHVIGMFGFSWFVGKLADTYGRKPVMLTGLVLSGLGAVLVATSAEYAVITLGTFFVGLGWSGAYVGATTVVTDVTAPGERGRAVGRLDLWSNGAGAILPILAGFLVEGVGIWAIGLAGVVILIYPLWLLLRLGEEKPGVYPS